MGMNAELMAIGPFSVKVSAYLDYPMEYWMRPRMPEGMPEGYPVITTLVVCLTTDQSYELAKACGCEAWNFATHKLDANNFNRDGVAEIGCRSGSWASEEYALEALDALINAGFEFYYRPEG